MRKRELKPCPWWGQLWRPQWVTQMFVIYLVFCQRRTVKTWNCVGLFWTDLSNVHSIYYNIYCLFFPNPFRYNPLRAYYRSLFFLYLKLIPLEVLRKLFYNWNFLLPLLFNFLFTPVKVTTQCLHFTDMLHYSIILFVMEWHFCYFFLWVHNKWSQF
jgi:hypothetical protein